MSESVAWTIIGALAAAIVTLSGVCYRLMLKLIKCHEVRVKYMEDQVDLVLTFRAKLDRDRAEEEER